MVAFFSHPSLSIRTMCLGKLWEKHGGLAGIPKGEVSVSNSKKFFSRSREVFLGIGVGYITYLSWDVGSESVFVTFAKLSGEMSIASPRKYYSGNEKSCASMRGYKNACNVLKYSLACIDGNIYRGVQCIPGQVIFF